MAQVITCPNCEEEIVVDESTLTIEDAANNLLRRYHGGSPSAGDVARLSDRLRELLVTEFGVSQGRVS